MTGPETEGKDPVAGIVLYSTQLLLTDWILLVGDKHLIPSLRCRMAQEA